MYSIILTLITQQNCVQMNICNHVHFFHIMENHIMWRVKFSLVLKVPPNLHYQRRKTSPMLLSSEHKSLNRLCAFIRCNPVFIPSFQVRVTRSFAWCVCFVDRCLSFCTFFFWPLCCLFFFDIRILITPLVFTNSSILKN